MSVVVLRSTKISNAPSGEYLKGVRVSPLSQLLQELILKNVIGLNKFAAVLLFAYPSERLLLGEEGLVWKLLRFIVSVYQLLRFCSHHLLMDCRR